MNGMRNDQVMTEWGISFTTRRMIDDEQPWKEFMIHECVNNRCERASRPGRLERFTPLRGLARRILQTIQRSRL